MLTDPPNALNHAIDTLVKAVAQAHNDALYELMSYTPIVVPSVVSSPEQVIAYRNQFIAEGYLLRVDNVDMMKTVYTLWKHNDAIAASEVYYEIIDGRLTVSRKRIEVRPQEGDVLQ